MADQSWAERPRTMPRSTLRHVAFRIAEHVHAHGLASIHLVLHGGEPLLAGVEGIEDAVTTIRDAVGPRVRVAVSVQTNAVRLDETFLRAFDRLGARVGVSLDGDVTAHDRHRRHADGRGSHAAVAAALGPLAGEYRHLFGGILCTVDVRNDPLRTYEALLDFAPPAVDFLLPHGNWAAPPPGRSPGSAATPYADWLIPIFDRWYAPGARPTEVRLFADIMHLLLGGASAGEAVGLAPARMVVIETDGAIEQSDTLKSAYPGGPATGFHVARDPFDAVLGHPAVRARQIGAQALGAECLACPVMRVCGGGLYAHRYRPGAGFANPSVYCADLFRLITHIRHRVESDVTARMESRR